MSDLPLTDYELERALCQEAVFDWPRFRSLGLTSADFGCDATRSLIAAAERAEATSTNVNAESVASALQRAGKLATLGGVAGLRKLIDSQAAPDPDRLKELRRLRNMRDAAMRAQVLAERGDELGAREALAGAVDPAKSPHGSAAPVDAVDLCGELVDQVSAGERERKLVHPGLAMMHRAMGPLMAPSCLVIGAPTNVGKSSVALAMLSAMARMGTPCGYVSAEDAADVPASRLLAEVTGVSSKRIATGRLDDDERAALQSCGAGLSRYQNKLWFSFCVGGTEVDACAAMSAQAARGARLVVLDYVQNLSASKPQQNRANDIRWIAQRVKAHAYRLGIVLVLISQLTRPPRATGKVWEPTKYDLKESGDLENGAEYILLLWRDAEDDGAAINVRLDKAKLGGIGARWQMVRRNKSAVLEELEGSFKRSWGK